VAPETESERILADIWQSLIGIDRVGVHDNFLEIGGDSLLATQVTARIRKRLRIELPISALFEEPTISALGRLIESISTAARMQGGDPAQAPVEREEVEF
jgi:acyl carrier protein